MKKKTARAKQKRPAQREKRIDDTSYVAGKRRGAVLKEEVWYEGQRIVKYSLAYLNPMIFGGDNGRVLGYDNSHDYHHRHFGGQVEEIEFVGYERLVDRFQKEIEDLWRMED